jgi:hypothetical protein
MQIASEDASGSRCLIGRQLCELVRCLVRPSGNMVELEAIKLIFQEADRLAVCRHLRFVIARLFHDLVYDQLRVTSDIELSDPKLGGDVQTVDKHLILSDIVRSQKMNSDTSCTRRGGDKDKPCSSSAFHQ